MEGWEVELAVADHYNRLWEEMNDFKDEEEEGNQEMTGIERIQQLAAELNEAIQNEFPESNQSSVTFHSGERINITVTEWERHSKNPIEQRPRRELWDQWFRDGVWKADQSEDQNKYYAETGTLLGKVVKSA